MGALLAFGVDAGSVVLDHRCGRFEPAIFSNPQGGDAAAAIVGHQDAMAAGIDADVAGPHPARRLPVDARQLTCLRVDPKRVHHPGRLVVEIADLTDGVQVLFRRVNRQERGPLGFRSQAFQGQFAVPQIQNALIDPAAAAVGIGSQINACVVRGDLHVRWPPGV